MNDSATFNMTFSEDETFNAEMNAEEIFSTEMSEVVQVTTSDHRELTHRDAEEQHPISSITYLTPELNVRPSTALSNQDIQNILNA